MPILIISHQGAKVVQFLNDLIGNQTQKNTDNNKKKTKKQNIGSDHLSISKMDYFFMQESELNHEKMAKML